jgi:mannose-6-phosphate isomerase-like protein (cupin superfamily)
MSTAGRVLLVLLVSVGRSGIDVAAAGTVVDGMDVVVLVVVVLVVVVVGAGAAVVGATEVVDVAVSGTPGGSAVVAGFAQAAPTSIAATHIIACGRRNTGSSVPTRCPGVVARRPSRRCDPTEPWTALAAVLVAVDARVERYVGQVSEPRERAVELVLRCRHIDAMAQFLIDELGMLIDTISPADDPSEIALSGAGSIVRLVRAPVDSPGCLRVRVADLPAGAPMTEIVAPDGTIIELVSASSDVVVPENRPSRTIMRVSDDAEFGTGRAGMGYRDLLPDRWGGRFIASHIMIADGGDVADYVHFHRIRFQMIFVAAGWVDVVYEDQGDPFRMFAGDCVLQPPEIRHRVLRSSPGLEVIEIGCPAQHDTVAEHEITLPTGVVEPERDFGGQRFVRHVAADAPTTDSAVDGFSCRDTGIGGATDGLAGARVLTASRSATAATSTSLTHDGEFAMNVVLSGSADLRIGDDVESMCSRDAAALPAGTVWTWSDWTDDFSLLDVTLPASSVRVAT